MTDKDSWASAGKVALAFAGAGTTAWYSPMLLDSVGLGEFAFVGQVCAAILVLSGLEAAFNRRHGSKA